MGPAWLPGQREMALTQILAGLALRLGHPEQVEHTR